MKRIKFLCLALAGVGAAFTAKSQDLHFKISGKLQNISPMPAKMYLSEVIPIGMIAKPLDSVVVTNGTYQFTGTLNADEPYGVTIAPLVKGATIDNTISVIVDKGDLEVVSVNSLGNFTVSGNGSTANHQFDDMRAHTKPTTDSIRAIAATEAYKTDKALKAEVLKRSMHILSQILFDMYTYAKVHPENRVSPYLTYYLVKIPLLQQPGKDTLVSLLPERVKKDLLGQAILSSNTRNKFVADSLGKVAAAKAADNLSKLPLGSKAPEFAQNDVKGKPVSLSSFKGKYVLIDFWASWCMPCRAENPNVVKAYNQYKDKGFTILGVSLDGQSTKTAWIAAIAKDGLNWTQVSDLGGWTNSAAKLYEVKSIPQNFLIDPNGVIIGKNLRGEELQQKLAALFKK